MGGQASGQADGQGTGQADWSKLRGPLGDVMVQPILCLRL